MKRSMLVVLFLLGMVGFSFGHDLPDAPGTTFIDRVNHLQEDALALFADCMMEYQDYGICQRAYADYIWEHPILALCTYSTIGNASFSWNPNGQSPSSISIQLNNAGNQSVQRTLLVVNGAVAERRLQSGAISLNNVTIAGPSQIRSDVTNFSLPVTLPPGLSVLTLSSTSATPGELFIRLE